MTFIRTFNSTLFNASYLFKGWAIHASSAYAVRESTVCLTSDNIALESIASSGTMRVTSLQIGDQNASLFEVPDNYQVVDMSARMGGINPKMFDGEEGMLGAIFSQTGENSDSNILSGIEKIIEAGDDDEAATDAALNAMLSMMGLPEGTLSADDTTAGVLTESLDSQLNLSDAEQVKAEAMMDENQRMVDIMQREGVAGLMREAGISESTIQAAERRQEKLEKMAQAHADKNKDLIEAGVASAPSDAETLDLEAELDALNACAEALANDGDVSEADKVSIQKDAQEMLQKILGGASQE